MTEVLEVPEGDPEEADTCPDCNTRMVEKFFTYEFPYGAAPNTVKLEVSHLAWECPNCELTTTDWRGEEARAARVTKYLAEQDAK